MLGPFRQWLQRLPFTDPLQREQATLLQIFLVIMVLAALVLAPLQLVAESAIDRILGFTSGLLIIVPLLIALALLRRGQLQTPVSLLIISLMVFALSNMIPTGLMGSRAILMMFVLPLLIAGLIGSQRALVVTAVLSIVGVVAVALAGQSAPTIVGYSPDTFDPTLTTITFAAVTCMLALLIDRFRQTFQRTLDQSRNREQELEGLRRSLEQQVDQRTADLRQALEEVEQREQTLSQTLRSLRASEATVRALSVPVIPVLPGVLVIPLIGTLDQERATALTEQALAAVDRQQARYLILDITGVPVVDTLVGQTLIQTAEAVQLLGTQAMLVGVRPEVAQTIISLQIGLGAIETYADLREATQVILRGDGWHRMPATRQNQAQPQAW